MAQIEEQAHRPESSIVGLETGIAELDKLTTGLRSGNLIIVAARPTVGKTALALNIAAHVAVVALLVLVPILLPEALVETAQTDVFRVLIYDPPPPPPPPLPKGSPDGGGRRARPDASPTPSPLRETHLEGGSLVPGRHDLRVVVSHREAVETLPHGYRVTARRPEVPIDGLEHDSLPVFTFQFHPEARREFVARRGLDPAAIDDRLVGDSDRLLDAFRRRVLSS